MCIEVLQVHFLIFSQLTYCKSHGFLNCVISLFVSSLRPVSGWGLGSDNRLSFASGNAACGVPSTGLQASKVCSLYQVLQPVGKHWSLPYPRFCKAASVQLQLEYQKTSVFPPLTPPKKSNYLVELLCQIPDAQPYQVGNVSSLLSMTSDLVQFATDLSQGSARRLPLSLEFT